MEEYVRLNTEADLRVVVEKYYIPIFYYVEQKVKSKEASEEITQETFLKLWEKREALELQPKALTAYLYKIAHNESINFLKAEGSRKLHQQQAGELYFSDEHQTGHTLDNGYAYLLYSQLRGDIEKAIDGLPEKCKQVFVMSREEDLKNHEIALRLNISNRMVEKHLARALGKLREALKAYLP